MALEQPVIIVLAEIHYPEGYKILDSAPTQLVSRKVGEAGNVVTLPDAGQRSDG